MALHDCVRLLNVLCRGLSFLAVESSCNCMCFCKGESAEDFSEMPWASNGGGGIDKEIERNSISFQKVRFNF